MTFNREQILNTNTFDANANANFKYEKTLNMKNCKHDTMKHENILKSKTQLNRNH